MENVLQRRVHVEPVSLINDRVTRNAYELRFSKETDVGVTNYLWDNQNIIQEADELSTVEAEYTVNPQPYGNLVSQRREDESTFYNYDALGSTQSLTDESATISDEYAYTGRVALLRSEMGAM